MPMHPTRMILVRQRSQVQPGLWGESLALRCDCGAVLDLGPEPDLLDIVHTAELHRRLRHPSADDFTPERPELVERTTPTSWPEADRQPEPGAISQLDAWDGVGGGHPFLPPPVRTREYRCETCGESPAHRLHLI